tara:strand:+ start:66 stop:365 length:300 start_codon:yes stop_codon:yes gene_type:complete
MPRHGSRINPHNIPGRPGYNPNIPSGGAYGGSQGGYGGPSVNGPARRPSYGQNPGYGRSPMPRQPLRGSRFGGQRQPMGYGGRLSGLARLLGMNRGRRY